MARDRAQVKLTIWEDEDFRALTVGAQHLYFHLMTSLKLDYAGVTDWRPGRIAAHASDWTTEDVVSAAKELAEARFIVIDESTEEVLLRSFIRHDGILENPNLAVAMRKAWAACASSRLRAVVLFELHRLNDEQPEMKGWPRVSDLLAKPVPELPENPSDSPSVRGYASPSDSASERGFSTLTATSTTTQKSSTSSGEPRKRGRRIPDDWKPTAADVDWQVEKGISDLLARRELERFVNYWRAASGSSATKLDWSLTWRNWLLKAKDDQPGIARPSRPSTPWAGA